MAGGGGIKASANMRALFSDNDHDHDKVVAVKQRLDGGKAKGKGFAAGDRRQAVASGEPESSGVGGDAARHDCEDKHEKERNKKQKKPQATASGEASTVLTAGESQTLPLTITKIIYRGKHKCLTEAFLATASAARRAPS